MRRKQQKGEEKEGGRLRDEGIHQEVKRDQRRRRRKRLMLRKQNMRAHHRESGIVASNMRSVADESLTGVAASV